MASGNSKHKLRVALAIVLFGWCLVYGWRVAWPAARASTHGFAAYYAAAHLLLHTPEDMGRVYEDDWFAAQIARAGMPGIYDIFNVQPPTTSLMLLPLAGLSPSAARTVWTLASLLLLLGGLGVLARALGLPARWGLWAFPVCLLYAPVTENLGQGQAYLLLFFVLCTLFWAVLKRRDGLAGTLLGLMLVLKSAAMWLWPLFLLERRWRAVLVGGLVAAGMSIASLPVIGAEAWLAYVALLPQLATAPERYVTAYQTVTSLTGHLFIYHAAWNPAPVAHWPVLARLLSLAVAGGTLVLSLRWGALGDGRHTVRALSLALFLSLVVANAPLGEGYHYAMVLPALLVALWWGWQARVRWAGWVALGLAVFLMGAPLPYLSARLQAGWWALLAYPRVYGAFILWGWLGWAVYQARAEERGRQGLEISD